MLPSYVCLHVTAMCRPVFRTNPAWHELSTHQYVYESVWKKHCKISCIIHNLRDFWPYIGTTTLNVWLTWQSFSLREVFKIKAKSKPLTNCCVSSLKFKKKPKWSTARYFAKILISPPLPPSPEWATTMYNQTYLPFWDLSTTFLNF